MKDRADFPKLGGDQALGPREGEGPLEEREDGGLILGCDCGGWRREGGFKREASRIIHIAIEIVGRNNPTENQLQN